MAKLLKWSVAEAPTGRYRSFQKRGWPMAYFSATERVAAMLRCEDAYVPADVRAGNHRPITVYIAKWVRPTERGEGAAFHWMRLQRTAATLDEAKALAEKALNERPEWHPVE